MKNIDDTVHDWLRAQFHDYQLEMASEDASFRKYYRLTFDGTNSSMILMVAPPDKEDSRAWLKIQNDMINHGLTVPEVKSYNLHLGLLVISDLGKKDYLSHYTTSNYYKLVSDAVNKIHLAQNTINANNYPTYSNDLIIQEMNLFRDWYWVKYKKKNFSQFKNKWQVATEAICDSFNAQPKYWVHRDYHSRNLLVQKEKNPGIIDFQDALKGSICYDLVSLLRDCYYRCPSDTEQIIVSGFHAQSKKDGRTRARLPLFKKWFDVCGLQRHLKAVGIFSRLHIRDKKSNYLSDIPRTLAYINDVSKLYKEFNFLQDMISKS